MVMEIGESLFNVWTPWTLTSLWSRLERVCTNEWAAFGFNLSKEELTLTEDVLNIVLRIFNYSHIHLIFHMTYETIFVDYLLG